MSRLHEDCVFPDVLQTINNSSVISKDNVALAECLVLTHTTHLTFDKPANDEFLKGFGQVNRRYKQAKNPSISRIVNLISNGQRPTAQQTELETFEVKRYLRDGNKFELVQDVLYRRALLHDESVRQLVLPPNFGDIAFKSLHDDVGHQGQRRTLSLLKARFHLP